MELFHNKNILGLSPMAGYTDSAFRVLCRKLGADFVVTELVSADGIARVKPSKFKTTTTYSLMKFREDERPIFIQLFGSDPETIKIAAEIVARELKPDGIDINMGCPAHKVVCNGKGSALMKNANLAAEIVRAAVDGSGLPVTVKTRLGWSSSEGLVDFCKGLEAAGASAVAIHGRTYEQGFSGVANWDPIYQVKNALKIPVLGNGDIKCGKDAIEKIRNLDGVLIGRGAVGNPWVFKEVRNAISSRHSGEAQPSPESLDLNTKSGSWPQLRQGYAGQASQDDNISWDDKEEFFRQYAKLELEDKGEHGIIEMRKFLIMLTKGILGASEIRAEAVKVKTMEDVESVLKMIKNCTIDS